MKTRTVKRHYCDFCGKGGFFKNRMAKHERGCTANPNRVCGMCGADGETPAANRYDLHHVLSGLTVDNKAEILAALKAAAHNCPACILAALRSHPKTTFTVEHMDGDHGAIGLDFRFKDEAKAWWDERNKR